MGCGLQKIASDTRDGVTASNQKQQELLDEIRKTNSETERLRVLTQQLVEGMNRTNAGVHLQILTQALQGLLSADATALLMPPLRMMPYAEVFAKEASADELIQLVYSLLTEVLRGFDSTETGDKRIRPRMVALTAASALSAFTPAAKTEEILTTHIQNRGRFEDTAYLFGLCRYNFIRDYFLKPVLGGTTVNIDSLRKVVAEFNSLKSLAGRSYADRFRATFPQLVEVNGTPRTYQDLVDSLKQPELVGLARAAVRRFQDSATGLSAEVLASAEAQNLLGQLR